jgi:hypothetical protein
MISSTRSLMVKCREVEPTEETLTLRELSMYKMGC